MPMRIRSVCAGLTVAVLFVCVCLCVYDQIVRKRTSMSHTAVNPRSQNSSPASTERNDYYDSLPFKGSHQLKYIHIVSAVMSLRSR